jgi:hypothetical protein
MGLYNILQLSSGEEVQFKWGDCDLSTYCIGDPIKWDELERPLGWDDSYIEISGISWDSARKEEKFYQIEIGQNVIISVTPIDRERFDYLEEDSK